MTASVLIVAVLGGAAFVALGREVSDLRNELSITHHDASVGALGITHRLDGQQSAIDGITSRVGGVEAQLHAQPDAAAVAKSVLPSVFTIRTRAGQGSAFVLRSQPNASVLITNFHAIAINDGSEQYFPTVSVVSGSLTFTGSVSGVDRGNDLASLTVSQTFPALERASKDSTSGDTVYAFGAPLGLEGTVTEGIVSTPTQQAEGLPHIQHTAAINPGNSGGPLVDRFGHVAGINELSASQTQGIFFAIPVNAVCVTLIRC